MVEIAKDRSTPRIQQLSIFLRNRLGALQDATARLREAEVRICAISILDAADHAVIRMVVNRPYLARTALEAAGYGVFESELLGVALPEEKDRGIQKVLTCLLRAEVDIKYVYSLIDHLDGKPVLALNVDNCDWAGEVLQKAGMMLVGQDEVA
ncbi:MAG: hypothetical protein JXQ29_17175 [Planctomycetes bacterium]|nr:hypothetical protein [Planctomycetota bacterium]